jgi:ATP-binding cassette, subfamily C, bacterial LapB
MFHDLFIEFGLRRKPHMSADKLRQSLLATGQYIARGTTHQRWPWQRATALPICGLPILEALTQAASLCGTPATASQLVAGLPIPAGKQLDIRLAPIALARLGLHAELTTLTVARLSSEQCPAMLMLRDGSCVILTHVVAGHISLVAQDGPRDVEAAHLAALSDGTGFVIGRSDPVNKATSEEEQSFAMASPKRWIIGQFLEQRTLLIQLAFASVLLNLCAFIVPLFLRSVYDRVVPNLAFETLWALSLGVIIALMFEFGLKNVRATFIDALAIRVGLMVQHKVMNGLLRSRLADAPTQPGGVLAIVRDVESLSTLIPNGIVTFCIDIPFFFLFLALIGSIGGSVTLVAFAGGVAVAAAGFWAHNSLSRASQKSSEISKARSNLIIDTVEGLSTIKTSRARGRFLGYWDLLADHQALGARHMRHYSDTPNYLSALTMQLVTIGVVLVGIYQLKDGSLTVGGLVACTMLAGRAMVPVSNAVQILSRMQQSLAVFSGLSRLLALKPEADQRSGIATPQTLSGDIRLQSVSLTYGKDTQPVLQNITLRIAPGERIGIIGRSGSGKSTLLHLISGLLQPTTGQITVDGVDLAQFPADVLRSQMAYAPQDALLFEGQLQENILLDGSTPEPERFANVVNATGVAAFAKPHAEGFQLNVGARGTRLSGGQRQSALLARALLQDTPMILLDEPTAAMDVGTELAVMQGLRNLSAGKTLLLATHRMNLLDLVDRVIWMDSGRIVADKPRAEILAMFQAQHVKAANAA